MKILIAISDKTNPDKLRDSMNQYIYKMGIKASITFRDVETALATEDQFNVVLLDPAIKDKEFEFISWSRGVPVAVIKQEDFNKPFGSEVVKLALVRAL